MPDTAAEHRGVAVSGNPTGTAPLPAVAGDVRGRPTPIARKGSPARWCVAVVVGAVLMLPFSWLLSHGALLPFFLGVFFFVLFGLIVGATMHRVASLTRPYSSRMLLTGTSVVVAIGMVVSVWQESRDCPLKLARDAAARTRLLGDRSVEEFKDFVAKSWRTYVLERYPPGGLTGYIRWVVRSGEIPKGTIDGVAISLVRPQRGLTWILRVVLSAGLLAFGIGSQTLLLRLPRDPAVRKIDERPAADS